ncbi:MULTISPECIES: hypothetical protein [Vibrio]|uniref:Uncharacterized protein n=1 Tax=Vibrio coralliilyticus TaxID=190893 RepID=A0A7Y3YVQ8_9VIBR|nr:MULTISPECIES: hypothetical protein [Vibrio]AIS58004.1 hypothetical protein JV59_23870 [Vibrio coralliilyticus]KPH24730.1 hypothetical protein ADU60_25465 [Vibrio coralliilyticus]MCC2521577.1 hypothetical protein [Vibrio coralliilyticus]NOH37564.1 hypothetical protein [Vibrio coralliilyticus]NOH52716.1 hypothetical protein [Vibrio coralliilyticus]
MSDLIDALKLVKKAYKPKLQKLKMTPEQVKQKVKVHQKVTGVLQGMDKLESLQKESLELVAKLVKTFVEQAPTMANQALAPLKKPQEQSQADDESHQSDDQAK